MGSVAIGAVGLALLLLAVRWLGRRDGFQAFCGKEVPGAVTASRLAGLRTGAVALFVLFLGIAAAVRTAPVQAWDTGFVRSVLLSFGPEADDTAKLLTEATGRQVMVYWAPLMAVAFWLFRRGAAARLFVVLLLGAPVLEAVFKPLAHRARPFSVRGIRYDSFPSGHAVASTVLAATLVALLLPVCRRTWQRVLLVVAGAAWPLLISSTRVYLGKHHLTDVVAGIVLGGAWVCLCLAVLARSSNRSSAGSVTPAAGPESAPAAVVQAAS